MFQPELLKGKRILVTGGGTGLGREIADKYLELGANLYLCGRRKPVLDDTAAALVAKHGGQVSTRAVDIRDAAAVDAMAQWIWDDGGPLDGAAHLAGSGTFYDLRGWTTEDWRRARELIKAQNERDKAERST
jgi:NAD(P)-dependent dehydrogenase (short-subunit alcohol dehydrogenase family)